MDRLRNPVLRKKQFGLGMRITQEIIAATVTGTLGSEELHPDKFLALTMQQCDAEPDIPPDAQWKALLKAVKLADSTTIGEWLSRILTMADWVRAALSENLADVLLVHMSAALVIIEKRHYGSIDVGFE